MVFIMFVEVYLPTNGTDRSEDAVSQNGYRNRWILRRLDTGELLNPSVRGMCGNNFTSVTFWFMLQNEFLSTWCKV